MKKTLMIFLLAFMLLMSACGAETAPETTSATQPPPTEAIVTEAPTVPTEYSQPADETEPPAVTEPTVPETMSASLGIEPGAYLKTFTDAQTRDYLDYYLFVPENAVEDMPLVIFLHGDGEIDQVEKLEDCGMINQAIEIYGPAYPFIAISPCTREKSWIDGTIPGTLKDLIDETVAAYQIDPENIIITGHSRGAIGVWYMISTYGDYFAAAVPISCPNERSLNWSRCAQVPVRAFVGTDDKHERRYEPLMQDIVDGINRSGGQASLVVLEGCTHAVTKTTAFTAETFDWMLNQ